MRSISVKITLVLVVVSLAGALFTSFYIQNRTQKAFDSFIRDQDQGVLVEALKEHYLINNTWENVDQVFQSVFPAVFHNKQAGDGTGNPNRSNENIGAPFILASPTGKVLYFKPGPGSSNPIGNIPKAELEIGIPIEIEGELLAWLVPAPFQNPRNNNQENFLGTVQQGLIISSLVTLLIALILGGVLIQSFTRPIRKLATATEIVASGDLGYQVDIHSRDELGKLAASFNMMSADLEKSDQARKQMTADIAHDLRTPLTIMQGYTEALSEGKMSSSQEIYQVMHQQTKHLKYLIEDLKTLSLLDSEELTFQVQNIDPTIILNHIEVGFSHLVKE
ncbi:MAG: HAMP domain-containing protein, partial [Anaerolineales bacterium]|nr:HAMP domain-containing protein [Anaerolineales bacterium]